MGQLRAGWAALALSARRPALRRAQLAFAAAFAAEWAFTVTLGVVAFREGGAAAVGLVGVLRLLPAGLAAPPLTIYADRFDRARVLLVCGLVRAVALAGVALALAAGAPLEATVALALAATLAFTLFRPAHSALLPSLCETPGELAAANVARGLIDSIAVLGGPLLAAALLELSSAAVAVAVAAALAAASGLLLVGVRGEVRRSAGPAPGPLSAVAEGLRALAETPDARRLVIVGIAQTFTRGALGVLSVVLAIEVLDLGEPGVGLLSAAVGLGAVLGSLGASALAGSRSLGAWWLAGVALWGLPLVGIALIPDAAPVLVLLAAVGVGNALLDLTTFTLLARTVDDVVLARVFGAAESLWTVGVGAGAALAPVAIALAGTRGAFAAVGVLCPLCALLSVRGQRRLDRTLRERDTQSAVLRRVPFLRALPVPALEHLAAGLEPGRTQAGRVVFEQGDPGDRYFVIVDGEAEIVGDGQIVRRVGPGDGFGEIALLRDCRRTATVRAVTDLALLALPRERFLPAVSGYSAAGEAADALVGARLADFAPRGIGI